MLLCILANGQSHCLLFIALLYSEGRTITREKSNILVDTTFACSHIHSIQQEKVNEDEKQGGWGGGKSRTRKKQALRSRTKKKKEWKGRQSTIRSVVFYYYSVCLSVYMHVYQVHPLMWFESVVEVHSCMFVWIIRWDGGWRVLLFSSPKSMAFIFFTPLLPSIPPSLLCTSHPSLILRFLHTPSFFLRKMPVHKSTKTLKVAIGYSRSHASLQGCKVCSCTIKLWICQGACAPNSTPQDLPTARFSSFTIFISFYSPWPSNLRFVLFHWMKSGWNGCKISKQSGQDGPKKQKKQNRSVHTRHLCMSTSSYPFVLIRDWVDCIGACVFVFWLIFFHIHSWAWSMGALGDEGERRGRKGCVCSVIFFLSPWPVFLSLFVFYSSWPWLF